MPPKRQTRPVTFRNTSADITTVDANHLEPGKVYLIQHKKEGLGSIVLRNPDPNKYITRFKGTFVRHDVGRSDRFPQGIPGAITNGRNVVVFENVQIISKPDKIRFTTGIYIIKQNGQSFDVQSLNWSDKAMRGFIQQGNAVAFGTGDWMFAEASDMIPRTEEGTLRLMGNDLNPYDVTEEEKHMTALRARAMDSVGTEIASYLGKTIPPLPPQHLAAEMTEIDGGRNRKSKKSRHSRKRRTMKRRRNYRK